MATRRIKKERAYGLSPLIGIFPEPIIAKRAPTTRDNAEIGTEWIDKSGRDVYFCVDSSAGTTYWINSGGGGGSFDSLVVTTTGTIGTNLTVGGTLTMSALTAGTVRTSAAGLVSTLADGTDGQVLLGGTGVDAAWGDLSCDDGTVSFVSGANSLILRATGGTANSYVVEAGGPVVPLAGAVTIVGDGANLLTSGYVANTVTISLADDIISVGKVTSSVGFDVLTGTTTILSDTNAGDAIKLNTNGGSSETITITNTQGVDSEAIKINSVVGGIALTAGVTGEAIHLNADHVDGKIKLEAGTGGILSECANGDFDITTGTGNINIGIDDTDHDISIGYGTGTSSISLKAGTGGLDLSSAGNISINSTAGGVDINGGDEITIGTDADAFPISIGTGAAKRLITIGNSTADSSVILNCGTDGVSIGANATAHETLIGSTNTTSNLVLQSGTGSALGTFGGILDFNVVGAVTIDSDSTIGIGVEDIDQNISIGTDGERTVTLGSENGAASTVIKTGTGNLDLGVSATAHTTRLGSTNTTCDTTIQAGTGAMTFTAGGIFDVNATGAVTVDGPSITGVSSSDAAKAIYLHANAGTSETIELENTQGTDAAAIALTSTAGGVTITADAATGIVLSAAGSTSIVGDTGTVAATAITLNKRVGVATFTGQTTASAGEQRYTITNSVCQATSGILLSVGNKSAGNDCVISLDGYTPAAGSFTVDTSNSGSQALDSDVIITWMIIN